MLVRRHDWGLFVVPCARSTRSFPAKPDIHWLWTCALRPCTAPDLHAHTYGLHVGSSSYVGLCAVGNAKYTKLAA